MSRMQGVNGDGEVISSAFVKRCVDPVIDCSAEPSLTRQEFAEECDINFLMKRFEKTGELPPMQAAGRYLDISEFGDMDLQRALNVLNDAEMAFASLPPEVRREFDNDGFKFVQYVEAAGADPEKAERLRAWGLAKPAEQPPKPQEVVVVGSKEPAQGDKKGEEKPAGGTPKG